MTVFAVEWIGWDREVVAVEGVEKHDLTEAMRWACFALANGCTESARNAHGFFIKKAKERPEVVYR